MRRRGKRRGPLPLGLVSLAAAGAAGLLLCRAFLAAPPAARGRRGAGAFAPPPQSRGLARPLGGCEGPRPRVPRAAAAAAEAEGPAGWVLPSVDKDVGDWHGGVGGPGPHAGAEYAWLQTTETVYVFAPGPEDSEGRKEGQLPISLEVENEGNDIRFHIDGVDVLKGRLANAMKPGSEIWMIEVAPDGRRFAVAELDKMIPGREWSSLMAPEVELLAEYAQPEVRVGGISSEDENRMVSDTLRHLQAQHAERLDVADDHEAVPGNVLTVGMQGYELGPDGSRGQALDVSAANGTKLELGDQSSGFPAEMHKQLVGIKKGETRDVQVTLPSRAGALAGSSILCAVECQDIHEQRVLELGDELARQVKQADLFRLAGTEEGIPEEEEDTVATFTLEELEAEIRAEVRAAAKQQEQTNVRGQLEEALLRSAKVKCDWADLAGTREAGAEQQLRRAEELAAVVEKVAEAQGFLQQVDRDSLKRTTWNELGKPKAGETMAEVGSDPDREYQAMERKVLRSQLREQVLSWLEERMKTVPA